VLGLAGLFVYLRVQSELSTALDNHLRSRADDLAVLVSGTTSGPPKLTRGFVEREEGFSQILTPDGKVVASTLAPGTGPPIDPELAQRAAREPVFADRHDVGGGLEGEARILAGPARSNGDRYVVVAGASIDDRREALAGIVKSFLIGAPLALVLASGLGYLLASRSLAPVEAMRRRAKEITFERSGERLPLPRAHDEVHRLGGTLNTMLDRLEASLEQQRVFVADASHELRTPLAVLRAELELADRPSRTADELREALRSAGEEVDRLSRLAEDLLVVASSDQAGLPINRERVELGSLLGRVGERFERRASEGGREIVVDVPADLQAELDVLRIEQALGNLIDNALRHGDGQVRLSGRRENGQVLLEVSDDGPGFPAGFENEAFERFTRADDGRTGDGAGLGLAIVQAIAAAHGGRVTVAASGNGTTVLRIALPLERARERI
jgi:two-component system OmpR family sensor kinase